MPESLKPTWICAVCGHEWLKGAGLPTHCASSKCRSRKWNGERLGVVGEAIAERIVGAHVASMGPEAFAAMVEACSVDNASETAWNARDADSYGEPTERSIEYEEEL